MYLYMNAVIPDGDQFIWFKYSLVKILLKVNVFFTYY